MKPLHSFLGLFSGVFVLLMSVSGSVLVFHEEIDRWQYPSINSEAGRQVLSIDQAYDSLRKTLPQAQIGSVMLPEKDTDPFVFSVNDPSYFAGTRTLQIFLHPQTGALLLTRGGSKDIRGNFMAWLGTFHNSFHLKRTGEWLLGFFAVVFCLSLFTGCLLYRKNILPVILFRKHVYTRRSLHQVVGVYALLFNLMIGISGFWMQRYVFRKSFYASVPPYQATVTASQPLFFPLSDTLTQLQMKYPGFTPYVVYFAQSAKSKTAVYGSRSSNAFIHSRKFADAVFLDSTGAVARTAFVDQVAAVDRYDIINSQVHMGRYGDWPVKVLYAALGLSGGILSITGALLWMRKKQ